MNSFQQILEQVLILRAQDGDPSAFEQLMERYHGRLLYYIRRLVGNNSAAQDVLQNVWMDA